MSSADLSSVGLSSVGLSSAGVSVTVNGTARDVVIGVTLAELVAEIAAEPRGVAAAVNDAVVPRSEWAARVIAEHDRVEILTAVQGG
jgi:sulfur carrier protein